jgi:hypothetical protein
MDLHKIILEKKTQIEQLELEKQSHIEQLKNTVVTRQFFDESLVLQEALNEFHGMLNNKNLNEEQIGDSFNDENGESSYTPLFNVPDIGNNSLIEYKTKDSSSKIGDSFNDGNAESSYSHLFNIPDIGNNSQIEYKARDSPSKVSSQENTCDLPDKIKLLGKMKSVKNDFGPNTKLRVGLVIEQESKLKGTDPVFRGRPALIHSSKYHPKLFQDIAKKNVYNIPRIGQRVNTASVPSSIENLIYSLQARLKDNTIALQECINTLAEEYTHSKRWKSQFEKANKSLIDLQRLRQNEKSHNNILFDKRQQLFNDMIRTTSNQSNRPKTGINKEYYPYLEVQHQNSLVKTKLNEKDIRKYNIKHVEFQSDHSIRVYIPHTNKPIS